MTSSPARLAALFVAALSVATARKTSTKPARCSSRPWSR
jgi:hypothetical protein